MKNEDQETERQERLKRKNDNFNPLEHDCFESGFSGVRKGDMRLPRYFKDVSPREATIFLMRMAGFKSKQICPIFKICPKSITRIIKKVYAKYPRLKSC